MYSTVDFCAVNFLKDDHTCELHSSVFPENLRISAMVERTGQTLRCGLITLHTPSIVDNFFKVRRHHLPLPHDLLLPDLLSIVSDYAADNWLNDIYRSIDDLICFNATIPNEISHNKRVKR